MHFLKLNQESTHERGRNDPLSSASGSWPIFCGGCDVTIPWPRCERPEDRRCVRGLDRLSLNCFDTEVWRDIFKRRADDAAGGLTSDSPDLSGDLYDPQTNCSGSDGSSPLAFLSRNTGVSFWPEGKSYPLNNSPFTTTLNHQQTVKFSPVVAEMMELVWLEEADVLGGRIHRSQGFTCSSGRGSFALNTAVLSKHWTSFPLQQMILKSMWNTVH